MKKILAICLVLIFGVACSGQAESWSKDEKENSQHFFFSLESANAATALMNEIGRGNQPKSRISEVVSLRKNALAEGQLVKNTVLRKANSELPEKFTSLYLGSLEQFIIAFEQRSQQASIRYSALADQWGNWYQRNKNRIKIPR